MNYLLEEINMSYVFEVELESKDPLRLNVTRMPVKDVYALLGFFDGQAFIKNYCDKEIFLVVPRSLLQYKKGGV